MRYFNLYIYVNALFFLFFVESHVYGQIEKVSFISFLNKSIEKKHYKIDSLEKALSSDTHSHNLFINKAVRFKIYLDIQNFSCNLYSENCKENSNNIGLANINFQNTFQKGISNADYLFKLTSEKDSTFITEYNSILNQQQESFSKLYEFKPTHCDKALTEIQYRSKGMFTDSKIGNNLISFNYILNPVQEILEGYVQEFSGIDHSSNENFYFTLSLPKSWSLLDKNEYTNPSTLGFYEPNDSFLNGNICISSSEQELFSIEEMKSTNINDNDIVDIIFENDELFRVLLELFNPSTLDSKITSTIFDNGHKKMILYSSSVDMMKSTNNDLLEGKIIKYLGSLTIIDGKAVSVKGAGIVDKGFDSYDYYSKLFFKVISSIKLKKIKKNIINLTEEQNMKFIHLNFKGLNYKFLLDTGASNICINNSTLKQLIAKKIVSRSNYVGDTLVEIADGSIVKCQEWLIPEISIGQNKITNITVSVIDTDDSILLFGMEGLNKLDILKLDLSNNQIILNQN